MIGIIRNLMRQAAHPIVEKSAIEAYDLWADSYDIQPGNLMFVLDEIIFNNLLSHVDLSNRQVADIGCGTGRHWQKLYEKNPSLVIGFDVSSGMLNQLKGKFPAAVLHRSTDNLLHVLPADSIHCLVSTLTIAHIEDVEEAIISWSRVLKPGGDLIITDFHPATLAKGGKRSFQHEGRDFSVKNYIHSLEKIKSLFNKHGLTVITTEERYIDEEVRSFYVEKNALHVYEQFKGLPVIYGLHLKKQYASQ